VAFEVEAIGERPRIGRALAVQHAAFVEQEVRRVFLEGASSLKPASATMSWWRGFTSRIGVCRRLLSLGAISL
jgi:hypothetical protein